MIHARATLRFPTEARKPHLTHGARPEPSARPNSPPRHHPAACVAHSIYSALYQTFAAGQAGRMGFSARSESARICSRIILPAPTHARSVRHKAAPPTDGGSQAPARNTGVWTLAHHVRDVTGHRCRAPSHRDRASHE